MQIKKYKSRHKDIRKTKESSYLINKSRGAGKKGNWMYRSASNFETKVNAF